jgi:hypothetical protein
LEVEAIAEQNKPKHDIRAVNNIENNKKKQASTITALLKTIALPIIRMIKLMKIPVTSVIEINRITLSHLENKTCASVWASRSPETASKVRSNASWKSQ